MIVLIVTGLVTDIFDGIVARTLGISTERLRRLDSSIDQVFWAMVMVATFIISPAFYSSHKLQLVLVVGLEGLAYGVSFLRFRREVATHAILSKIWTITICITIVEAIAAGNAPFTFDVAYYLGVISRIEIILILFCLRYWTNDVPSLYHAIQLRKGKEIKRNKWFNG